MNKQPNQSNKSLWLPYFAAVIVFLIAYLFLVKPSPLDHAYDISYSEFKVLLKNSQVSEVVMHGDIIDGTLAQTTPIGPHGETSTRFKTQIPAVGDETLLQEMESNGVKIWARSDAQEGAHVLQMASSPPGKPYGH